MFKLDGTFIKPAKVTKKDAMVFFRLTKAFGFGFMQDIVNFFKLLDDKKIPIEIALGSIKLRQEIEDHKWHEDNEDRKKWIKKAKKCPNCGNVLMYTPIRAPEGPGNVKGYKGRWYCTNGWAEDKPEDICGYESFTHKTLNYYLKKYGIKRRVR